MCCHSFCSLFWDAGSILGSKPCPSRGARTPITPLRHPWVAFAAGPRVEEVGGWNSILVRLSGTDLWDLSRAVLGCAGRSARGSRIQCIFWEAVGNSCMLQAELAPQGQFHIKYSQCLSIQPCSCGSAQPGHTDHKPAAASVPGHISTPGHYICVCVLIPAALTAQPSTAQVDKTPDVFKQGQCPIISSPCPCSIITPELLKQFQNY